MSAAGHAGVCEHDYMHINGDPKFYKMLASNSGGNERLIFSIVGVKVNRKGKSQERALLVTNRAIYNTIPSDIRKCQRRIPLEKIHHLTVSNSCDNFVRRPLHPTLHQTLTTHSPHGCASGHARHLRVRLLFQLPSA